VIVYFAILVLFVFIIIAVLGTAYEAIAWKTLASYAGGVFAVWLTFAVTAVPLGYLSRRALERHKFNVVESLTIAEAYRVGMSVHGRILLTGIPILWIALHFCGFEHLYSEFIFSTLVNMAVFAQIALPGVLRRLESEAE
jgi:hypothetical protein